VILRREVARGEIKPTVIRPTGLWPGLALGEAWQLRQVCIVLAQRVLKVRYRQAAVGIGWALIQPILLMIAFTLFFGLFARLPTQGIPYPLFFFSGLTIWQITAKLLAEGSNTLIANSVLLTRIFFPRVYFPAAVALSSLVDLFFNGIALLLLLLYFGFIPDQSVLAIPMILAIVYAASLGLSMWFAALNVAYRDVGVLLPFIVQVGFFVSPIIYPATIVPPQYLTLYFLNPIALGISAFRWAVVGTPSPPLEAWIAGTGMAILLLVSGYLFFRKREGTFADML
jgi:lipopolysaccharide transport system permease protein